MDVDRKIRKFRWQLSAIVQPRVKLMTVEIIGGPFDGKKLEVSDMVNSISFENDEHTCITIQIQNEAKVRYVMWPTELSAECSCGAP